MTGTDAPMIAVVGLVVIAAALWLMAGLLIPPDRVACPNIDASRAPLAQDGREGVWRGDRQESELWACKPTYGDAARARAVETA